ncbi:MAG: spore maturation protein A [Angelakisella sp.]
MMSYVIGGMILLSVLSAILMGKMPDLSAASLNGCKQAVDLAITLSGSLALWGGVMKIAEKSGITKGLCSLLSPLTKGILFRRLPENSPAFAAISMNLAANLLGLGNAATPLGLAAMRELEKEAGHPTVATREMVVFVALNTASMQLIPTTTAFLRLQMGSADPMEILVPVWISSFISVVVAVSLANILYSMRQPSALRGRPAARPVLKREG